jgi:hypothetical protein
MRNAWYPGTFFGGMSLFSFIAIALSLVPFADAQSPSPQPDSRSVSNAFASIEKVLSECKDIEFQSEYQVSETDDYFNERHEPVKEGDGRTTDVHFIGRGDKYWFNLLISEYNEGGVRNEDHAYDGAYYQIFNHKLQSLWVTRHNLDGNDFCLTHTNALEQFAFLMLAQKGTLPGISWNTVKDPRSWAACLMGSRFVTFEQVGDKPCMVVAVPGGSDKDYSMPIVYTVDLSLRDGFFPIAWKSADLKGRIHWTYRINQLGKVAVSGSDYFYYPIDSTATAYAVDPSIPAGRPIAFLSGRTDILRFNQLTDDRAFTMDPSMAIDVIDAVRNVAIPSYQVKSISQIGD